MNALLASIALLLAACTAGQPAPRGPQLAEAARLETQAGATAPGGDAPAGVVGGIVRGVAADVQGAAGAVAADARETAARLAVPAVLELQGAVEAVLPPPAATAAPATAPVASAAVALIVRHEIISPAYYQAHLQGFACPGDISGPTIGIGYDLGMQTATRIRADWRAHPAAPRLATGSGVTGFGPCRTYRRDNADIRTPFALAEEVFETASLPAYHALAARAFRDGWDGLPPNAQGALVVTVYVRGAGMRGETRAEMRQLRDDCVPAHDVQCIARAHRAMCARFEGRADAAGLCQRFRETAELAVRA
ncbi:MAG: hypothetical protein AB7D25_02355 [Thermomonas sp.]